MARAVPATDPSGPAHLAESPATARAGGGKLIMRPLQFRYVHRQRSDPGGPSAYPPVVGAKLLKTSRLPPGGCPLGNVSIAVFHSRTWPFTMGFLKRTVTG